MINGNDAIMHTCCSLICSQEQTSLLASQVSLWLAVVTFYMSPVTLTGLRKFYKYIDI